MAMGHCDERRGHGLSCTLDGLTARTSHALASNSGAASSWDLPHLLPKLPFPPGS